jgi:tetratricopeptide (TPR) repeat protein
VVYSLVCEDAPPSKQLARLTGDLLARIAAYRHWALPAQDYEIVNVSHDARTELSLQPEHLPSQHGATYAQARPLYERALIISEKAWGPDHPRTALTLTHLALLLQAQGDLAGARPLFSRALEIEEKQLGYESFNAVATRNNLAGLLHSEGDLPRARQLYESVLASRQKYLGLQHPYVAASLNSLGLILYDQGDLSGAQPLMERALAIREKVLGSDHHHTAMSLDSLARVLQAQGDLVGARPLFERALAIREKVEALTRAAPAPAAAVLQQQGSPLRLDVLTSLAYWNNSPLDLSLIQFWILKDLFEHVGEVRSITELMRAAHVMGQPNTIVVHIKTIREEIQKIAPEFACIKSERARGYRWVDDR